MDEPYIIITVINHASSVMETNLDITIPTSCTIRPMTSPTTTPQSSCSCSDQQQTSASSFSDSNVVIITVPIVVVLGVIIVIVIVVIGILIWRKTKSRNDTLPYDKVLPTTVSVRVENDLYGLVT